MVFFFQVGALRAPLKVDFRWAPPPPSSPPGMRMIVSHFPHAPGSLQNPFTDVMFTRFPSSASSQFRRNASLHRWSVIARIPKRAGLNPSAVSFSRFSLLYSHPANEEGHSSTGFRGNFSVSVLLLNSPLPPPFFFTVRLSALSC